MAGRLDGVQITTIIGYGAELLVSLATQDAPLTGVFRITARTCSLTRVWRWHDERTRFAPISATTEPSCSPISCWAATPPASRPPLRQVPHGWPRVMLHWTTWPTTVLITAGVWRG
jgi:hypothetical protein